MKTKNYFKLTMLAVLISVGLRVNAQVHHFEWQNVLRDYIVHAPSQHEGTVPVLFFLHGLGDNISRVDAEYNFTALAERYGWVMVIPQARSQSGSTMWNAAMYNSSIDDVGFLMALLDSLTPQYNLDQDSVFFTGFSMGGFMSHRMAIEKGDRITAAAPVSGLITFAMGNVTPVAPVRLLHIHGTNDPVVGYNGASQYFGGTLGLSVDAIINYWCAANSCVGEPEIDTLPNTHNDGLRFVRYTYNCGTDFKHLKVIGGNHTWYHNSNQYDISYMDEIYAFFTGTQNGSTIGLAEPMEPTLKVWPNPTTGMVEIQVTKSTSTEVFNLQGQKLMDVDLCPGTNRVDMSSFPAGMYLLKDRQGNVSKILLE